MTIDEFKKVNETKKYVFCRIAYCKYYSRGKCFINKIPQSDKCDYCEEEK